MKRIISGLMALTLIFGSALAPEALTEDIIDVSIEASAATDAWGREYLTYGDFKYQVKSDNTITIIGFDVNKTTAEIPSEIDGQTVTEIGKYAFYQASALTEVIIPDTITTIGEQSFRYCSNLKSVTIPDSVTKLKKYAFAQSGLESIIIPDSVTEISDRAFFSCDSLKTVQLPDKVDYLGSYCFYYCVSLESINLPSNITSVGGSMFYNCSSLKEITIPSTVTEIDDFAFWNCSSLTKVVISEGLTKLGLSAFEKCTGLTELNIPSTVTEIGDWAFYECSDNLTLLVHNGSYGLTYALVNSISFKVIDTLSDVTGVTVASKTANSVRLTWDKLSDATGYIVYRYDEAEQTWVKIAKSSTNSTSYIASKLSNGTTYRFAVKAYKTADSGEILSKNYSEVSVTTELGSVSNFKVDATSSVSIRFTWDKLSNADGYIIYKYDEEQGKFVRVAKTTSNIYSVKGLSSGTTYDFYVNSYKKVGSGYIYGTKVELTASTNPAAVTGFQVEATSSSSIRVTWDEVNGANGYIVYKYDEEQGKLVRAGKTTGNVLSVKGLSSGTSYKLYVQAYKKSGTGYVYGATVNLTSSTNPAKVSLSVASGTGKATLKWTKTTGANGYIAYYKTSADGAWTRMTKTTARSYTKTGLTSGKTYYFCVRAYRIQDGKVYYGGLTTKTVTIG